MLRVTCGDVTNRVTRQVRIQDKNEPPQIFPILFNISPIFTTFPRFFTNKMFQGSQVRTLR